MNATRDEVREAVARAIACGLGDNFDHAFVTKAEWTQARGEKGGRARDINEPMQGDYLDAADAAIAATEQAELNAENTLLRQALEWYREQSRLARLIHSEGDAGRQAIAKDGGARAHIALTWKEQP